MTKNPQKINNVFQEARKRFLTWIKNAPTGDFKLEVNVRDGGIRGKPKIGIKDEL